MRQVWEWIQSQKEQKEKEKSAEECVKQLQKQVEMMTKQDNRQPCHLTGVNLFANLETMQGEGGVDLAAKAQAAMVAANNMKRRREEDAESEGESVKSHGSLVSVVNKQRRLQSGIGVKSGQRVRYEVEWAHHWLGKEYEANPISFNQMKVGHYLMGESDIILNCSKPEEIRARLILMRRLGYWLTHYDWPSARNVYAAILRGVETGCENWNFDVKDYEDMLNTNTVRPSTTTQPRDDRPKRPRDVYFCGPYQKGECSLDAPHISKFGIDSAERTVLHVCSSCLLKDGKKLNHPNGGPECPRGCP